MPDTKMRPVSELISELFRRKGMMRPLRRAEAVLLWPRVVGADVARFSVARTLSNGVLTVDVSDSETAMHLSLQRRRFLARYHETYDVRDVKEIRFQVGRVGKANDSAAGPGNERRADGRGAVGSGSVTTEGGSEAVADPQAVAALARELEALHLPDDLSGAVMLAGRSLIGLRARQKASGFTACPTCGALHDGLSAPLTPREAALRTRSAAHPGLRDRELCLGCRRYAREPRVTSEARRLARRQRRAQA
ncbi:MAG TPA: DUF721 domain-containing protein, partial [Trueperaceae bacterium]|nr:DUF721 domain-containing protein [Trueperaceae bacterium]